MKNEFDQLQEQSDLEILKSIVPSWVNERVEPFIANPVDSVVPPVYNDVRFDPFSGPVVQPGNSTPQPGSIVTINARQVGSTFVPTLITHVEGTISNDL